MKINRDKLIKIIDFWHRSIEEPELFSREAIENIDYSSKEIVDIIGPRRCGKSSLLKLIISRFGMSDNFLYVNFEDPFFIENNEANIIEELISVYKEHFNGSLKYLFFDEIQEIENWEKAVRKLRDGGDYKIFITGSSSTLLSKELSSLITGRHITTRMMPLSFQEFLFFEKIEVNSQKDIILKEAIIRKKFSEYMETGGFPEIVVSKNKELLKNYFYDFLQKDVVVRHKVRDQEALEKMAVFLMSNSGKIISIASMKKAFDLSFRAANNYLEYLKEAFMIFELGQFSFSLKKQSKALSKIYSVDSGLARAVSFNFSEDKGRILENLVFLHLLRKHEEIYYYKTKNNLEIDFLIRKKGKNEGLIQACWSLQDEETKKRELKSLTEAMDELNLKKATIVAYDEYDDFKIGNKIIKLVPAWKWMVEK
ncbi:MAG: ATP-binding protein [Candidatus Moranbacteria bacterium]|jgi:predicted AAA+ superfamily ATPase|nr:ATP-binding protein [Candidatus Moranbacteria bacterium]